MAVETEHWEIPKNDSAPTSYLSISNDIRNTKNLFLADIDDKIHFVNSASIDYKGVRVLVQSVIQGILIYDQKNWNSYGTFDDGKTFKKDFDIYEPMKKLCEFFQLKTDSIFYFEEEKKEVIVNGSPEIKGVKGGDCRSYIMDYVKLSPRDANFPDPILHESCTLRPELIRNYRVITAFEEVYRQKNEKNQKKESSQNDAKEGKAESKETPKEAGEEKAAEAPAKPIAEADDKKEKEEKADDKQKPKEDGEGKNEVSDERKDSLDEYKEVSLGLDPSLLTPIESRNPTKEADLQQLKKMASYILTNVIPYLINEFTIGNNLGLLDSFSLIEEMHKMGVNTRYLGKIYDMLDERQYYYLKRLIERVVLVRSFVKYVRFFMLKDEKPEFAPLIVHCLNYFMGDDNTRTLLDAKTHKKKTNVGKEESAAAKPKENGAAKDSTDKRKGKNKKKKNLLLPPANPEIFSPDSHLPDSQDLLNEIVRIAKNRYCFTFKATSFADLICIKGQKEKITFLREVSKSLGLVMNMRNYLVKESPNDQPVKLKDVVDFSARSKYANFVLEGLRNNSRSGEQEIAAKNYDGAATFFRGYQQLIVSGYGLYNADFIYAGAKLASVAALRGDYDAAVRQQLLVVKLSEKVHGLDSIATAQAVVELASFMFFGKRVNEVLGLQCLALYLFDLIGAPLNPYSAICLQELQMMYSQSKDVRSTCLILEETLRRHALMYGESDERLLFSLEKLAYFKAENGEFRDAALLQARHALITSQLLKGGRYGGNAKVTAELEKQLAESNKLKEAYVKKRDEHAEGKKDDKHGAKNAPKK